MLPRVSIVFANQLMHSPKQKAHPLSSPLLLQTSKMGFGERLGEGGQQAFVNVGGVDCPLTCPLPKVRPPAAISGVGRGKRALQARSFLAKTYFGTS